MLVKLDIQNYALIDKLEIDFFSRLTTITGETGSGKSILLGALGLILGNRADLQTIHNPNQKCIIEGTFNVSNFQMQTLFEEENLDYESEIIIRREISPNGKSRSFVNDTPVTLNQLGLFRDRLIDIHSQNHSLQLSQPEFQFLFIDAFAENTDLINQFQTHLKTYKTLQLEIKELKEKGDFLKEKLDYNQFLLDELTTANFKKGEQEELEEVFQKQSNTEEIRNQLGKALEISTQDEIGLDSQLDELLLSFKNISTFSSFYQDLFNRINSIKIDFQDLIKEIENQYEDVDGDPEKLKKAENRLSLMYELFKKHKVENIADLEKCKEEISQDVYSSENSDAIIRGKEKLRDECQQKLDTLASQIHKNRKKVIPNLKKELEENLSHLGMENALFNINIVSTNSYKNNGKDEIIFNFSANKGLKEGNLKKVASGGEISRIMLSIKQILSRFQNLPTIIFDEIDTGVSGEISKKMGTILKKMSKNIQVIAITHLPQVAAMGDKQVKVKKSTINDKVQTKVFYLDDQTRIVEIAQMLGGKTITRTAELHAKELLENKQ